MQPLLFDACARGDTITISRLHQEDGSVLDQRTESQDTPLHLASRFNHTDLASMIINLQEDMLATRNEDDETPLHVACRAGGVDIIELLLNHRPDLAYSLNRAEESALFIACSRGHSQVAFNLANTLPSLAWDQSGSFACLLMAAKEGDTDIVKKILRESPRLASKKDENGFSALHLASRYGKLEVIKEFLGQDPYLSLQRGNDGRTPLHWAVMSGQLPVVEEFLLERDRPAYCDLINSADNNGDTVLHLAATMNSTEIFKFLVSKRGMKVHARNGEGMTAIDILNQKSIGLRRMHTAAQVDADVPIELKRKMQNSMFIYFFVMFIDVNPNRCNQKNDIPGMETFPLWLSTAYSLFLAAYVIIYVRYASPRMLRRPGAMVEAAAMISIEIALIRFWFKIADDDLLSKLILYILGLVPLMFFSWIWHKLAGLMFFSWISFKLAGLMRRRTDATGPRSD